MSWQELQLKDKDDLHKALRKLGAAGLKIIESNKASTEAIVETLQVIHRIEKRWEEDALKFEKHIREQRKTKQRADDGNPS